MTAKRSMETACAAATSVAMLSLPLVADNRSSLELLGQVPPNLLAVTSTFVSTESPARSISIGPGPAGGATSGATPQGHVLSLASAAVPVANGVPSLQPPPAGTVAGTNRPLSTGSASSTSGVPSPGIGTRGWGDDSTFGHTLHLSPVEMLLSDVQGDIVHTFIDRNPNSAATFTVTAYWALQFHGLRDLVCESPRSVAQSLAFCAGWAATGGKSGASFEKTSDERFVIKHVKSTELDMFVHNGAKFFQHMFRVLFQGQPSLLVKYVGAYKVQVHDHVAGKKTTAYLLVLENLFMGGLSPSALKFDLKGKNRASKPGGAKGRVLLDADLMQHSGGFPIILTEGSKALLNRAVEQDTRFLCSLQIIDYSVLVALDYEKGEITVGIIDYVRRFDWISRFESGVKRRITAAEPTVVQPMRYRERLCQAVERYFGFPPSKWTDKGAEGGSVVDDDRR